MAPLMSIPYLLDYVCFISLQESWVTDILIESSNGDSSNEYSNLFSYLSLYFCDDTTYSEPHHRDSSN